MTKRKRLLTGCGAVVLLTFPLLLPSPAQSGPDARTQVGEANRRQQASRATRRSGDGNVTQGSPQVRSRENSYTWVQGQDHSGWKALSNFPTGYVIAGSKFFEPANNTLYITGFDDYSHQLWTVPHATDFSTLDVFWKSFTQVGSEKSPSGFFLAASGTREGVHQYYTLQTDKFGKRTLDKFGALAENVTFGGVSPAVDGGYIAAGGNNSGNVALVKFDKDGVLQWQKTLPQSGFGWSIKPASGGGYVIGAGSKRAIRVDVAGEILWNTLITLPASPDTSAYSYTEFEEIIPLEDGSGYILTGSAFSNSSSGVYTARVNPGGDSPWAKVNDVANTALAGTPVCWANSAVELFTTTNGARDILFTWRKGPVSTGGTLQFERLNPSTGAFIQGGALGNEFPVQEAFTVQQHFLDRLVIAGTRGGYGSVYSFTSSGLPAVPSCGDNGF